MLVPVFTPQYFNRPWCLAEFHTMLARERRLGVPCIAPLRYSDGDFFADEARRLQRIDVEAWAHVVSDRRAPRPLRHAIKTLCEDIFERVRGMPPDPQWEFVVPRTNNDVSLDAPDRAKPEYPKEET